MTIRKTIKVKRVPDEGSKGDCIDEEDTLKSIISLICAKCRNDLRSTRVVIYVGSGIDRRSSVMRLRFPIQAPTSFLDVALSRLRIPPARRHLQDHDAFY